MPVCVLFQNGSTPLFLAVMAGNQQVVKELLASQAEQQVKITRGVGKRVTVKIFREYDHR